MAKFKGFTLFTIGQLTTSVQCCSSVFESEIVGSRERGEVY